MKKSSTPVVKKTPVCYRLIIWHLDLTHKIKTRESAMDGQQPSSEWSPSIPRIVHHPKFTRIKYDKDFELGIQTSLARLRPFDKIKTRLQLRLQLRLRDNGQGSKDKGKEIRPKIMKLKLMLTLNTKFCLSCI